MTEPLIAREGYDAEQLASTFERMAATIRLNKDNNFGGAFVLVPPPGFGEPVESIVLNSDNAKLQFWANLKMIVDQTFVALKEQQELAARR